MFGISKLIAVLQVSISPVILISGMGLLILAMTNQLGRVIDRTRKINTEYKNADPAKQVLLAEQLKVLWKRAKIVRLAITYAMIGVLLAACIIILLFLFDLFNIQLAWIVMLFFLLCLISIILSISFFILDINQALRALSYELFIHKK